MVINVCRYLIAEVAPAASVPTLSDYTVSDNFYNSNNYNNIMYKFNIDNTGGSAITAYGVVYSASNETPTVGGLNCSTYAPFSTQNPTVAQVNLGASVLTLTALTTYYVRGYATNTTGTAYTPTVQVFITNEYGTAMSLIATGVLFSDNERWTKFNLTTTKDNLGVTLNSAYIRPGSPLYLTDPVQFGWLYRYDIISTVIPTGWRLPTKAEMDLAILEFGVAGLLQQNSNIYWSDPQSATNTGEFYGRGNGEYFGNSEPAINSEYKGQKNYATIAINDATYKYIRLYRGNNLVDGTFPHLSYEYITSTTYKFVGVRLVKETITAPVLTSYITGDNFYNTSNISTTYIVNVNTGGETITNYGMVAHKTDPNATLETSNIVVIDWGTDPTTNAPLAIGIQAGVESTGSFDVGSTYYISAYVTTAGGTSYLHESREMVCMGTAKSAITQKTLYATEVIGSQTWFKFNVSVGDGVTAYYPGDNSTNELQYGLLYNWTTANTLAPSGWHLPSNTELNTLIDYYTEALAGGKLKETGTIEGLDGYWTTPNTGANNDSRFYLRGAGRRTGAGIFSQFGANGYCWTSTERNAGTNAYALTCDNTSDDCFKGSYQAETTALSVRLIKNPEV